MISSNKLVSYKVYLFQATFSVKILSVLVHNILRVFEQDGGSPCGYVNGTAMDTYGVYSYAYNLFESAAAPVIYTPGDNEWTDWWVWVDTEGFGTLLDTLLKMYTEKN